MDFATPGRMCLRVPPGRPDFSTSGYAVPRQPSFSKVHLSSFGAVLLQIWIYIGCLHKLVRHLAQIMNSLLYTSSPPIVGYRLFHRDTHTEACALIQKRSKAQWFLHADSQTFNMLNSERIEVLMKKSLL